MTVGTQLPFDRLVEMVDKSVMDLDLEGFGQIGEAKYLPVNIESQDFCSRNEFIHQVESCDFVVSYAGIGGVLTSLRNKKPIILMARKKEKGEHRNNHQVATVRELRDRPNIYVVGDEVSFREAVYEIRSNGAADHELDLKLRLSEEIDEISLGLGV